ncbi:MULTISPECIES: hypothetical protein [Rhizobium]|uniref:hypothetical protein n=1 Tax=Rhizobium TaxID=379 RepID=UPI00138AD92C|nr:MULTISPECIES: hypothetical protein [Rhizobium]
MVENNEHYSYSPQRLKYQFETFGALAGPDSIATEGWWIRFRKVARKNRFKEARDLPPNTKAFFQKSIARAPFENNRRAIWSRWENEQSRRPRRK